MKQKTSSKVEEKQLSSLKEMVKKGDWDKVAELLQAIEGMKISKNNAVSDAWRKLAVFENKKDNPADAVVSLASARKHALNDASIYFELLEALRRFVLQNYKSLSLEDIVVLKFAYDRLDSFQKPRFSDNDAIQSLSTELSVSINSLVPSTRSKSKSKSSTDVHNIYNALYADMTQEEVRAEFARLFMEMNAEEYERRLKEKQKGKKKATTFGGSKKPPKKGDDDTPHKDDDKKKPSNN